MTKKIILGIVLALILIMAIVFISAVAYNYPSDNMFNFKGNYQPNVNYHNDNIKMDSKNTQAYSNQYTASKDGCYEEIIQVKDPGECIGEAQTKKQCYRHVITCSGQRTESIDCYPEVPQVKGDGECIGVPQVKGNCYRQVVTCSGMRTESIDCYPEIDQEKGYGECMGIPQEKGQCYKIKDYSRCN